MVALVSVETVLLVLLLLLVAGLLRSHAEILRRLGPAEEAGAPEPRLAPALVAPPTGPRAERAAPISGTTPDGDAVALDFAGGAGRRTLLAFLTTACSACTGFWETLDEERLPGLQTVIVTHGPERERPARLRTLARAGVPVVMSSEAFADYRVPGSPYFVLVDRSIRGEGVATTWDALASLLADAVADEAPARGDGGEAAARGGGAGGGGGAGAGRAEHVDAILAEAGIGPGHPSLYPGGASGEAERP